MNWERNRVEFMHSSCLSVLWKTALDMASSFLVFTAICGAGFSSPLSDSSAKDVPVRALCLPFSDPRLGDFIQLGCSVKSQLEGETQCALVETCPTEPPTDQEQLMVAWKDWKSFLETGNLPGEKHPGNYTGADNKKTEAKRQSSATTTETTTTTVETTTQDPSIRMTHSKCLRYRRPAMDLYKRMGCTVNKGRRCSVIESCPSACSDEAGQFHTLNSDPWFESERKQCRCVNIRQVRAFLPRLPRSGMPLPPFKHCYTFGCVLWENDQHVKPNEPVVRIDGRECVCVEGRDPGVQDDAPPFHLDCGASTGR